MPEIRQGKLSLVKKWVTILRKTDHNSVLPDPGNPTTAKFSSVISVFKCVIPEQFRLSSVILFEIELLLLRNSWTIKC